MKAEFPQALYAPSWQTRDFSSLNHHLEAQYRGMNSLSLCIPADPQKAPTYSAQLFCGNHTLSFSLSTGNEEVDSSTLRFSTVYGQQAKSCWAQVATLTPVSLALHKG